MRIIQILLVGLIFNSLILKSQTNEIKYYTYYGTETSKEKAEFYRKIITDTDKIYIEEYTMNDEIKMKGEYKLLDPFIENGKFEYYYHDEKLRSIGFYKNGLLAGKWFLYDKNGEIKDSIDYEILNEVKYIDYDTLYDKINVDKKDTIKFIRSFVNYPERAIRKEISGIVEVEFVINKSGEITNIEVIKSVDIDLDIEAKRSVASLRKMEPYKKDGVPINKLIKIPVKFILN